VLPSNGLFTVASFPLELNKTEVNLKYQNCSPTNEQNDIKSFALNQFNSKMAEKWILEMGEFIFRPSNPLLLF
jgi:hypothetical protein